MEEQEKSMMRKKAGLSALIAAAIGFGAAHGENFSLSEHTREIRHRRNSPEKVSKRREQNRRRKQKHRNKR